VTLINTDGMSFIGPGSEWFWTALTGIVLAITFIALYRQLRLQAHASAVEQIESFVREANSEEMNRYVLELLVAMRDNKDPTDLPRGAAYGVANFWEKFATLARFGHRDLKLIWQVWPAIVQSDWATLAPWIRKERAEVGDSALWEQLEWLAGVMADLDRRAGRSPITPEGAGRGIDYTIALYAERIRTAQALRTFILAPPEAATAGSSRQRNRRPGKGPVSSPAVS
jgi:hypothetical protein